MCCSECIFRNIQIFVSRTEYDTYKKELYKKFICYIYITKSS